MQITFKRRLTNELLTTYLPSFFLLGICYSTIHFKSFYFEAAVTVNLTVMLVATTLFVRFGDNIFSSIIFYVFFSVMEKLPPTSYLRLVDIWLITTQLTPFLLVALITSIEFFQEENFEINHHGMKR